MKRPQLFSIILIFLMILFSCNKERKIENLNGFDISPDIGNIIYSYKKDSFFNLYQKSIEDGKVTLVLQDSGNYVNPKYIEDGQKIISIFYPKNTLNPEFHVYDVKTRKVTEKIIIREGFISDYTFHSPNEIYYLKAHTFDSYSPIAPKAFHDFDVFKLDLNLSESKKISNLNSYYLGDILKIDNNNLLITARGTSSESGLFVSKIDSANNELVFDKILIKNDTLRNSEMYSNPLILPNGNILCSSSYQMVELDLKSKTEYPILPSNGLHYSMIRNVNYMVFYKQRDYTNNIYYFDLKKKEINVLDLTP